MFRSVTKRLSGGVVALLLLSQTALAQDSVSGLGLYFSGALGASVHGDFVGSSDATNGVSGDFDTSGLMRIAVGGQLGSSFRAEAEYSYRSLQYDDTFEFGTGPSVLNSNGGVTVSSLKVNGLYDIPLGATEYVAYVGGGLGVAEVDVDLASDSGAVVNGAYTGLASQVRVGVERGLSNGMSVFADYTFFRVNEQGFNGFNIAGGAVEQAFGPINSHELAVGLRLQF